MDNDDNKDENDADDKDDNIDNDNGDDNTGDDNGDDADRWRLEGGSCPGVT